MKYLIPLLLVLTSCAGMVQREALEEARALPYVFASEDVVGYWKTCFSHEKKADRVECARMTSEIVRAKINLFYINADKQWAADYWTVNKGDYLRVALPQFRTAFEGKDEAVLTHYLETAFYEDLARESNAQIYAYGKAVQFQNSMNSIGNSLQQMSTNIRLMNLESKVR